MILSFLNPFRKKTPLVAVLHLSGMIMATSGMRRGLNIAAMEPLLDKAFSIKNAKAVALVINSPGGSPVQSALIFERIRYLSKEKNIPVISFVEDVAASGGYWLACAGDEIYVNAASVVGSIGVISAGFGFDEAIAKLGISRRVHTSGARKSMLDPFSPEDSDAVAHLKKLQEDIHGQFITMVKARRGARLKGAEDELFSGAFWTGRQALGLGLADHEGELRQVLEGRFGKNVRLRILKATRSRLHALTDGISANFAEVGIDSMVEATAERLARARYGL